jgi:decaprenyl-phosphate phosphoribosyltransferase
MVLAVLKSLRFHRWVKNLFVLGPLVFARRVDNPRAVFSAVLAMACFCLLSSAVYVFNDIVDVDKDRALVVVGAILVVPPPLTHTRAGRR